MLLWWHGAKAFKTWLAFFLLFISVIVDIAVKYAMRDLVQKLPSGNPQHDHGTSDDTIAAVLATLNEVIKKQEEFSRSAWHFRMTNLTFYWKVVFVTHELLFLQVVTWSRWCWPIDDHHSPTATVLPKGRQIRQSSSLFNVEPSGINLNLSAFKLLETSIA